MWTDVDGSRELSVFVFVTTVSVQKRLNESRCRSEEADCFLSVQETTYGRHLVNIIEQSMLDGDAGCHYRYFINLLLQMCD